MQLLVRQLCTLVYIKPKKTACHIMQQHFKIGDTLSIQHYCITIWHLPFNFQVKPSQHFSESPSCSQTGHAFIDKGFHGRTLWQGERLSRMEIGWGTKWKAAELKHQRWGTKPGWLLKKNWTPEAFQMFLPSIFASILCIQFLSMEQKYCPWCTAFFLLARAEESSSIVWRIQFPSDQLPKWLEKVAGRDVFCPSCQ